MSNIFSELHEDKNGKKGPLEPLVDAMQYYMGEICRLWNKFFRMINTYRLRLFCSIQTKRGETNQNA